MRHAAAIVLAAGLVTGCATYRPCTDDWTGRDKLYHFTAGAATGAAATALADPEPTNDGIWLGVAAGFTIGAGKEAYDTSVRRTCWSWKDLVWTAIGGAVGGGAAAGF